MTTATRFRQPITTIEELRALMAPPREAAVRKQSSALDEHCRDFIARSPFVFIATSNAAGDCDVSPKGHAPGFVRVLDKKTIVIPDRRGNNRLDSLQNIVRNPAVGLLFLVPGKHETFRVNGEAVLTRDPALIARFEMQGKLPRTVVVVRVKEAYIHCSRALLRADLWNPEKFTGAATVPSMGTMLAKHTCGFVDAETFDEDAKVKVPLTLY